MIIEDDDGRTRRVSLREALTIGPEAGPGDDEDEDEDELAPEDDPESPEYDPTPYCSGCGARRMRDCHCGPRADND